MDVKTDKKVVKLTSVTELTWNSGNTLSLTEFLAQVTTMTGITFSTQCSGNGTCTFNCNGNTYVLTGLPSSCHCGDNGVHCDYPCADIVLPGCSGE